MAIGKTQIPQLDYKGWQQSRTTEALRTTVTLQQTQQVLTGLVGTSDYVVGASYMGNQKYGKDLGVLEQIKIQPADGPFWNMVLNYNNPLSTSISSPTATISSDPTENSLTVKTLSMPLETHPEYLYRWNHALLGCCITDQQKSTITGIAITAGISGAEALISNDAYAGRLKWIKSPDQIPTEKETVTMPGDTTSAGFWKVLVGMTKAGVECYQLPTYQIVQKARHNNRNEAAWAVASRGGYLCYPGGTGDFGLQNRFFNGDAARGIYHWRCLGAQLDFDGKYWVATCTYEWSPDPRGWDQQLYKVRPAGEGGYGYNNKNSIFYISQLDD